MKTFLTLAIFAALATPTLACQFDTDCMPGSSCVKSGGIEGVCMGGVFPGNNYDNGDRGTGKSTQDYDDTWGTKGNTCQFSTDCGPGWTCVKGSGIYGTCVQGN